MSANQSLHLESGKGRMTAGPASSVYDKAEFGDGRSLARVETGSRSDENGSRLFELLVARRGNVDGHQG
jgi:hypothetical protein